jgi:LacI family transcriptional regulator
MEKKLARIKDIAQKAGVSAGTVDRVIHNRGEVSAETRKKVLNIISELEYQPNPLASSLAMRKNFRFGVLIPEGSEQNPYWKDPIKGIEKAGSELIPYGVILDVKTYSSTSTTSFRQLGQEFLNNPPDGLLLAPAFYEESKKFLKRCEKIDLPIVFIDAEITYSKSLRFIGQNSCQSGHVAGRLLGMGQPAGSKYLIFNIIGEKDQLHHFSERSRGFKDFFKSRNISAQIVENDVHRHAEKEIEIILDYHIKQQDSIAGIFVTGSQVFRVAKALSDFKHGHIRLLGFDLVEHNINFLNEEIIDFLISQQPEEQAYIGIQTLYSVIVQNQALNSTRYIPIEIITRENLSHYIQCS